MANPINEICIQCRIRRYIEDVKSSKETSPEIETYLLDAERIIQGITPDMTMLQLSSALEKRYHETFGVRDYTEIKHHFNQLMMQQEESLRKRIRLSKDPFVTALKMMLVGNYIDYGIFREIDEEVLRSLLQKSEEQVLDESTLSGFRKELTQAERLVYITDNCGEIVLDKLFIEQLHQNFPKLHVTVMVRGGEVVNDASRVDAIEVGIGNVAEVIDNGVALAGTQLDRIGTTAKEALLKADVIISKGQANAESLFHEGLNVYYCFLCKCDYFAKLMHGEKMKIILFKE